MPVEDRWAYEKGLWAGGHRYIAGVDEAGRGPLAGPVTAAAVILPEDFRHDDIRDSKLLTARQRERTAPLIQERAVAWAVASSTEREIEEVNILQATLLAMARAVEGLDPEPTYLLVDHLHITGTDLPQWSLVRGDRLSASIAAASILAKVARDRIMTEHHERYPEYDFASNKGYGTARHRAAIRSHGPCPVHRRTFRGVVEFLD